MIDRMDAIALDDEGTWPPSLVDELEISFDVLRKYEEERSRIDSLCAENVSLRRRPPTNEHEAAHERILARVSALIGDLCLVGYHCTRLHVDEIEGIRRAGLVPLGEELVKQKIARRVAVGDFSRDVANQLLTTTLANVAGAWGARKEMIWFVFTRELLRDESGIWRLISFWGGEALYIAHEENTTIGPILTGIGTACIVEAAVPVRSINSGRPAAERVVCSFLDRRGVETEHGPQMEGYAKVPVGGELIRGVVTRSEAAFEELTTCSAWSTPPT